jgi:Fe-S cluster biosynthesis and repair protein YggX
MTRNVHCARLGREAPGLDKPPFPGPEGERIFENISRQAWDEWLAHQTLLINENRLKVFKPEAKAFLAEQRESFLFGGGAEKPAGYVPPKDPASG